MSLKNIVKNILPLLLLKFLQKNIKMYKDFFVNPIEFMNNLKIIHKNNKFYNIHKGKRCFILCGGPSINTQPIEILKNEIVFGVSAGYLHEKYSIISPVYHVSPQFTYKSEDDKDHAGCTKKEAIEHLEKMEDLTNQNVNLFFNITEKKLIEKRKLFENKKVNYVYLSGYMDSLKEVYKIDKLLPCVSSAPILCLMIAMYMGFKEIYLLGTDHDNLINKTYFHAYKDKVGDMIEKRSNLELFKAYERLFTQYTVLNSIAKNNHIKIFNMTNGGMLDVFERVKFSDVFN